MERLPLRHAQLSQNCRKPLLGLGLKPCLAPRPARSSPLQRTHLQHAPQQRRAPSIACSAASSSFPAPSGFEQQQQQQGGDPFSSIPLWAKLLGAAAAFAAWYSVASAVQSTSPFLSLSLAAAGTTSAEGGCCSLGLARARVLFAFDRPSGWMGVAAQWPACLPQQPETSQRPHTFAHSSDVSCTPCCRHAGLRVAVRSAWAGLAAGCLHTLAGADHLAALTPLTIGRSHFKASLMGALWGFGHSTGQLILGLLMVVLKDRFEKVGAQELSFTSLECSWYCLKAGLRPWLPQSLASCQATRVWQSGSLGCL